MDGVVVADEGVDADGSEEADEAGEGEGWVEVARGPGGSVPGGGEDAEGGVEDAGAEAGAVVGDQGDEAGVEGVELLGGGGHVLEVLGDEDVGDADEGDGEAGGEHGGGGGEEKELAEVGTVGAPV